MTQKLGYIVLMNLRTLCSCPRQSRARPIAVAMALLLMAGTLTACQPSTAVSVQSNGGQGPSANTSAVATVVTTAAPMASSAQTETPASTPAHLLDTAFPIPKGVNRIISFLGQADLDGDGIQETVEVGRSPLIEGNFGETYLYARKSSQIYSYPFNELERRGYSEDVELQDVDGDGLPEILISRDIGGNGLGGGRALKFHNESFTCIFDTNAVKPDIHITYADHYQLRVQSKTMRPSSVSFALQPGPKYEGTYDGKGKLLHPEKVMIDPSIGMRSVRTRQSGPADIEVTQWCSGVGGHADSLGVIRTVYRYRAQGWRIVSTAFEFMGQ